MHYKNGRPANNGEPVVGKICGNTIVGLVQDIQPAQMSCNCTVIRPGGLIASCVTVGDLYHAEDAVSAIEAHSLTPPPDSEPLNTSPSTSAVAAAT